MADNPGQILYNVKIPQDGSIITTPDGIDIYKEILDQINVTAIKKLGIQAPTGTICYINNKEIMIGRTGMYELEDIVTVSSLYFVKKQIYILKEDATKTQLENAKQTISALEAERKAQMEALNPNDSEYYTKYIAIEEAYYAGYSVALELYNQALQGIYIQGGEEDLENIIVDYLY